MASNTRSAQFLGLVLAMLASSCGTGSSDGPASSLESPETRTVQSSPPRTPTGRGKTPTGQDQGIVRALIRFARSPGPKTVAMVPLADDGVWLGLADQLLVRRSPNELIEPEAWVLQSELFRAYVGSFSAPDLLARTEKATVSAGPHPHCASPPVPPPQEVAQLRRVSVQPRDIESCLKWWTVDVFVRPGGEIKAVTLDLWEP
jgi:hypothetical protein